MSVADAHQPLLKFALQPLRRFKLLVAAGVRRARGRVTGTIHPAGIWHDHTAYQTLRLYFQRQEAHTGGMPKKPAVIPTKKPVPLVKPIPPVPLAVITPVKPGQTTNATSRITRPNPVVRRGKR
jgi:hypothetical protein